MSTLNVSNITDGTTTVGTSYVVNGSAKAWASWTQGGSNRILDSINYSSYTDLGTGRSRLSFTSSMASSDYSQLASGQDLANNTTFHIYALGPDGYNADSHTFSSMLSSGSFYDSTVNTSIVAGDLA